MSTSTTPAVGPDQPDPIRDIKAALEGREGWHDLSAKVQRKGDTLLIAGLCVTPPAEAQPVGEAGAMPGADGGFTTAAFKAADVPVGTKLYTAPPSAPVGVERILAEMREEGQADIVDGGVVLEWEDDLRNALAQQPAVVAPAGVERLHRIVDRMAADRSYERGQAVEDLRDALAQQPAAVQVERDSDGNIVRVTQGGKVIAATTYAGGGQPAAVDEDTIEKIALLFTRSGEYFVGDRDECLAKARKAVALAGQQGGRADG